MPTLSTAAAAAAAPPPLSPLRSPTPSISSQRTSLDTTRTSSPARTTAQPRRNRADRAALRDYYGLKAAAPADASSGQQQADEGGIKEGELDKDGFDAQAYVDGMLAREGLQGVLKEEGDLVNQIKFLDGERKALVYDNYSKLITATETIKRMRANMDPLAPTTSTLAPAIAHIAVTAEKLAEKLQPLDRDQKKESNGDDVSSGVKQDRETVAWVLDAPRRLQDLEEGEREEEWKIVESLLDRWNGVEGVEKLREECKHIMEAEADQES